MSELSALDMRFGDRVHVTGFTDAIPWPDSPKIFGLCTNVEILARNTFTNIPSQTLHELNRRQPDGRPVSVTNNGYGFDPDSATGVLQGHFDLQGIQERIDEIGGTFEISSAPGKGTKAMISVAIPREH